MIQHQKNKNPQIFILPLQEKKSSTEQHQYDRSDLQGCTKNMFYLEKNSSKLCTEGAIGNLMNVLHCPENEVKQFWDFVQLHVHLTLQTLGESSVPKAVLNLVENVIQFKKVCGFSVKKSSSALQVCSESNTLKTCKKKSTF
jgi:hypothetical protein